jgi:nucleoside-diphosphate-sugar epimerase
MNRRIAVIGSTGFVGGNIIAQIGLDHVDGYNSKNIEDIAGKDYDLIFCAGARAEMWKVNKDPEADRVNNQRLMRNIAQATADRLIVLSTVAVYPNPVKEVDEDSVIIEENLAPYGLHHLELERFCQNNFKSTVIRLPGLFGEGLKKNVIYDFIHNNNLGQIHSDGVHQYYYLRNIWRDIQTTIDAGIELVNFATPPISVTELADKIFGRSFENRPPDKTPAYFDFRTKFATSFGGKDGYMQDKATALDEIRHFVRTEEANLSRASRS